MEATHETPLARQELSQEKHRGLARGVDVHITTLLK